MPNDTTTRWTVSVSKDTDIAVRSFLAQRGMKKGDLSKFIEEAGQVARPRTDHGRGPRQIFRYGARGAGRAARRGRHGDAARPDAGRGGLRHASGR